MVRFRSLLLAGALVVSLAGCGNTVAGEPSVAIQPVPVQDPLAPAPSAPVKIDLPSIGASDDIVPVGLDAAGEMELPPVTQVGWYKLAPRPGQTGRAVLAGHVDYGGTPGAFKRLAQLKPGDDVVVTDAAGMVRRFDVTRVERILKADYQARTVPLVFNHTSGVELALVTCGGKLVGSEYDSNDVVIGTLAA